MLLVMSCEYINALMSVYMSRSARMWRSHDCVQTQSSLEFRDISAQNLIVDMVETELALFLPLNHVRRGKLLEMMRNCRLRDIEEGVDVRAV